MSGHSVMSEITKPIVHQLSSWGTYIRSVFYSLTNYRQYVSNFSLCLFSSLWKVCRTDILWITPFHISFMKMRLEIFRLGTKYFFTIQITYTNPYASKLVECFGNRIIQEENNQVITIPMGSRITWWNVM